MKQKQPETPHFLEQRYLLALYNKVGLPKSIFITSLTAFVIGTLVIVPINMIMGGKIITGIVINIILCCTVLPYHLYQMISLLSQLDAMRKSMHDISIRDELTQAYNRHFLKDKNLSLIDADAEIRPNTSLLLIDLDDLKEINDKHGHNTGDEVLRALAEICHSTFRSTDIFIRYGGDEFICLLPETNIEQTLEIAARIQNKIKQILISVQSKKNKFTVSIGASTAKTKQKLTELISQADKAVYKAKKQGKNKVEVS